MALADDIISELSSTEEVKSSPGKSSLADDIISELTTPVDKRSQMFMPQFLKAVSSNPAIPFKNVLKNIPFSPIGMAIKAGENQAIASSPQPTSFVGGAGKVLGEQMPNLVMALPFVKAAGLIPAVAKFGTMGTAGVGLGAYSGTQALAQGRFADIPGDVVAGFGSGVLFGGAERIGASAAVKAAFKMGVKPALIEGATSLTERIGSVMGTALLDTLMTKRFPAGERMANAVFDVGMSALMPSEALFKHKVIGSSIKAQVAPVLKAQGWSEQDIALTFSEFDKLWNPKRIKEAISKKSNLIVGNEIPAFEESIPKGTKSGTKVVTTKLDVGELNKTLGETGKALDLLRTEDESIPKIDKIITGENDSGETFLQHLTQKFGKEHDAVPTKIAEYLKKLKIDAEIGADPEYTIFIGRFFESTEPSNPVFDSTRLISTNVFELANHLYATNQRRIAASLPPINPEDVVLKRYLTKSQNEVQIAKKVHDIEEFRRTLQSEYAKAEALSKIPIPKDAQPPQSFEDAVKLGMMSPEQAAEIVEGINKQAEAQLLNEAHQEQVESQQVSDMQEAVKVEADKVDTDLMKQSILAPVGKLDETYAPQKDKLGKDMPIYARVLLKLMELPSMREWISPEQKAKFVDQFNKNPVVAVDEMTKQELFAHRMFEDSVPEQVRSYLKPLQDEFVKITKELGKGAGDKWAVQDFQNKVAALMSAANTQIYAKDMENLVYTLAAKRPHLDAQDEADFVNKVNEFYSFFGQKPTFQPGVRTPAYWELLGKLDPRLQNMLMFWKSQLETPLLENQVASGVYANANIISAIQNGYIHKSFGLTEDQMREYSKNPQKLQKIMETMRQARSETRSYEEFLRKGHIQDWVPIEDFFASAREYAHKSFLNINQAHVLAKIKEVPINDIIRYKDPKLKALNEKNPSPYRLNMAEFPSNDVPKLEAERMSKLAGEEVTPQKVLTQNDFAIGREIPGLSKHYKGGFEPPWVYKSMQAMLDTMFFTNDMPVAFDHLISIIQMGKHLKTVNPIDTPLAYAIAGLLPRSPFQIVVGIPKILGEVVKETFLGAKRGWGELHGKTQETSPTVSQDTNTNYHLNTKLGLTSGDYSGALHHLLNKTDTGIKTMKELQSPLQLWKDYYLSAFGTNKAIFENVVNKYINEGVEIYTEKFIRSGQDPIEARRQAVYLMNQAGLRVSRAVHNSEGRILDLVTFARSMTVSTIRNWFMLAYPFLKGSSWEKIYNYHTGRLSKFTNSFTNAEMSRNQLDTISEHYFWDFGKLMFIVLLTKGLLQYGMSFLDDDQMDEHKEVGSEEGPLAKKRFIFNNEPGNRFNVRLPTKDWNNKREYADLQGFRMIRDTATGVFGTLDRDWGDGLGKWAMNRAGLIGVPFEMIQNKDRNGDPIVFDDAPLGSKIWGQAKYGAANFWMPIGIEAKPGENLARKIFSLSGGDMRKGEAVQPGFNFKEAKELRIELNQQRFLEDKARKMLKLVPTAKLYEYVDIKNGITPEVIRNEILRRTVPQTIKLKQKSLLRRSRMKKIMEKSNLADDIAKELNLP